MAQVHSKNARILTGTVHLSTYAKGFDGSFGLDTVDTTVLTDTGQKSVPGFGTGTVTVNGFLDSLEATMDPLIAYVGAVTDTPVTLGFNGFALGAATLLVNSRETKWMTSAKVADIVAFQAEFMSDGQFDAGYSLHDLASVASTTTGSSLDNAADTTNGGVGHLHVTAFSGSGFTVKVQHSTDNSGWSDLFSFSAVSGTTSEHTAVAAGTTVDRYLRYVATVTGATPSASMTFHVSFARR